MGAKLDGDIAAFSSVICCICSYISVKWALEFLHVNETNRRHDLRFEKGGHTSTKLQTLGSMPIFGNSRSPKQCIMNIVTFF